MMRYYTATSRTGTEIHLVRPADRGRASHRVPALCPAPVRGADVRRAKLASCPGGARTVEDWQRIHGGDLCFHCRRMSGCETGATV